MSKIIEQDNIDTKIQSLIDLLRKDYKVPGYVYSQYEKFIPGITPVYYSGPYFNDLEIIASVKAMLIGKWMSAGENVVDFEKSFSKKTHSLFSCMVNSGSSANLAMMAGLKKHFDWKDGDEIIVSSVGFPTTVSVIPQNGLRPIFIDIELNTLNFDIDLIEEKITNKTRAIFLSPVLGNPPDIDKILELCEQYELKLILDNCDSLGSQWDRKFLNEYAVSSSCSFYAAHEICTFEGGMISTNDRKLIDTIRSITTWGRGCVCSGIENLLPNGVCNHRFDKWLENHDGLIDHKYYFLNMGYNLKPLDVCGAVGVVQLEKLDEICLKRKISKKTICGLFQKYIDGVKIPSILKKSNTVWFGSPIICKTRQQKDKLVKHLEANKIQTRNYFAGNILVHLGYQHLGNYENYPIANIVLDRVFFVGASPSYNKDVFSYIEKVLKEFNQ